MSLGRLLPNFSRILLRKPPTVVAKSNFHVMASVVPNLPAPEPRNNFLVVPNVVRTQTCGFKVKGQLRKRCKDCYFVRRQERLFVLCEKNPRHKQMSMVKDERNTWILTHATQGKVRPW